MQVSDEMVEKAAREMFDGAVGLGRWDDKFYAEERAGCLDGARRCLTAALAGHVVVPREPTEEMLDAGGWAIAERNGDMSPETEALAQVAYAAMIDASQHRGDDAAPPPAGQEG